ncbi:MAG: hypothetical protein HYZ73_06020 [Elusimicrobia bacterium]|nr:hypothetical protein [Elusimicrobiota bacterium]
MSPDRKQALVKGLSIWLACFALVAGFLYYHSAVPPGPVIIAGVLTFLFTLRRCLKSSS